jgi:hypothetical protein
LFRGLSLLQLRLDPDTPVTAVSIAGVVDQQFEPSDVRDIDLEPPQFVVTNWWRAKQLPAITPDNKYYRAAMLILEAIAASQELPTGTQNQEVSCGRVRVETAVVELAIHLQEHAAFSFGWNMVPQRLSPAH